MKRTKSFDVYITFNSVAMFMIGSFMWVWSQLCHETSLQHNHLCSYVTFSSVIIWNSKLWMRWDPIIEINDQQSYSLLLSGPRWDGGAKRILCCDVNWCLFKWKLNKHQHCCHEDSSWYVHYIIYCYSYYFQDIHE